MCTDYIIMLSYKCVQNIIYDNISFFLRFDKVINEKLSIFMMSSIEVVKY